MLVLVLLTALSARPLASAVSGVPGARELDRAAWERPGCHRLGHSRTVDIEGCVQFSVLTNACRGFCESWAFPATEPRAPRPVTSQAQCCSIMEAEDVTVSVLCRTGRRNITLLSATACACYQCRKN